MDSIVARWKTIPADAAVLADWTAVSAVLAAKHSTPYSPTSAHDFMHNKILVCDDTVITGSYNFSTNAQCNAENQVRITDPALAGEYADYLQAIATTYRATPTT
jgi:phosphatidylserine/phosphatidylglycerophosphate/cardiolipin synthase-like enzyme